MQDKIGGIAAAALFLLLAGGAAQAQDAAPVPATQGSLATPTTQSQPAALTLGGQTILRLRSGAGGMTAQQRIDVIDGRLTRILAVPDLHPDDVVVYTPPGKPPVIYVLGRRLITVDAATVKAAGGGKPIVVATQWAKRLQQILPLVDYRLPNESEPTVPAHPPLTITSDFSKVGGQIGEVRLRDKVVIRLRGPQPGAQTAAERADIISARLGFAADKIDPNSPDAVQVEPQGDKSNAPAAITVGGTRILTVEPSEAKAAKAASPALLAASWVKNIRAALGLNAPSAAPAAPTVTPAPAVTPAPTEPAKPQQPPALSPVTPSPGS